MRGLENPQVNCPYCGENFEALIDCSVVEQDYIEDCEICCAPIEFSVRCSFDGNLRSIELRTQNE